MSYLNNKDILSRFSICLMSFRATNGMSIQDVADRTLIPVDILKGIENENYMPTIDVLLPLSKLFNTSFNELLGYEGLTIPERGKADGDKLTNLIKYVKSVSDSTLSNVDISSSNIENGLIINIRETYLKRDLEYISKWCSLLKESGDISDITDSAEKLLIEGYLEGSEFYR